MTNDYGRLRISSIEGGPVIYTIEKTFDNGVALRFPAGIRHTAIQEVSAVVPAIIAYPKGRPTFHLEPPFEIDDVERFSGSLRSALGWLRENPELLEIQSS